MATKLRTGRTTLEQRADALTVFNKLVAENFTALPMTDGRFRVEAKFVDLHMRGLRASDPLHLATASDQSATVFTLVERLATAGPALGVPTQLPA